MVRPQHTRVPADRTIVDQLAKQSKRALNSIEIEKREDPFTTKFGYTSVTLALDRSVVI
ncbi:microsomal omega6 desaturase enzyme [Anopheles sinensis]|uniref:Microsomal omega6 desaturase enzyme n=1 Tax=Anopheles sinensis TaxID=74873 RepID=A0A084VIY6_ANOSI|nr:microsomal omega6 desaturase enzyme [Anopheles sinensis]